MERNKKIKDIANHYGVSHQSNKAIEEMAELTQALCKISDAPACDPKVPSLLDSVIDEIADVCVLMEQMKLFYGPKEVEDRIDFKIDRQIERICMGRD